MRSFAITLIVFLVSVSAFAQTENSPLLRNPHIRAAGTATVHAKPDQVRIDIGVITRAQTAAQASADNARQFAAVVAELKKILGENADIQTSGYNISPDYKYPKEGGTPTIVGYVANNNVRVTSRDVDNAGKLIDASSRVGANAVRGIEWSLRDEQAVRTKALTEAARVAKSNAEALAAGVGLKISRILRVEDTTQDFRPAANRPMMQMARAEAMSDSVATPVEAGNIQIQASVVITAELSN